MANLAGLAGIVAELRTERTSLVNQLKQVDAALSALGTPNGTHTSALVATVGKRGVSAAARRKMSLAQKARWAKVASSGATVKPKRVMSATARRKIAAAMRARWAKIKSKSAA